MWEVLLFQKHVACNLQWHISNAFTMKKVHSTSWQPLCMSRAIDDHTHGSSTLMMDRCKMNFSLRERCILFGFRRSMKCIPWTWCLELPRLLYILGKLVCASQSFLVRQLWKPSSGMLSVNVWQTWAAQDIMTLSEIWREVLVQHISHHSTYIVRMALLSILGV